MTLGKVCVPGSSPLGAFAARNSDRPVSTIVRLGRQTAPTIDPIVYAFRKETPRSTTASKWGVFTFGFPKAAIPSGRRSSARTNTTFGGGAAPAARPVSRRAEAKATEPVIMNLRREVLRITRCSCRVCVPKDTWSVGTRPAHIYTRTRSGTSSSALWWHCGPVCGTVHLDTGAMPQTQKPSTDRPKGNRHAVRYRLDEIQVH